MRDPEDYRQFLRKLSWPPHRIQKRLHFKNNSLRDLARHLLINWQLNYGVLLTFQFPEKPSFVLSLPGV